MGPNSATNNPPSAKRRKLLKKRGRPRTSVNARNLRVSLGHCLDRMPMYETPLTFVFGVLGIGLGEHFLHLGFGCCLFVIGVLSRDHFMQWCFPNDNKN